METPKNNLPQAIKGFFYERFDMRHDKESELQTIESIRKSIEFKGANLWILIFAIFLASLGLNVNSTAVIIGAMLISPLMGPIIGMGLAVGVNDFEMMKRSMKNYAISTGISIATATVYFLLTPLDEAQSELLARTSPNLYDVLIALFGGLAGIVALCAKDKGNVLPGVAIATALMPPLCTAGFGLATGNWIYALGAFYLFFINTVFISLATFIGVRVLNFPKKVFVDKAREKRVKQYIIALVVVTMCPSFYLTFNIVKSTFYTSAADSFISQELDFKNTQVISRNVSYTGKSIEVVLIGAEVPEDQIALAGSKLAKYKLGGTSLQVIQGMRGDLDVSSLKSMVMEDFYKNSEARLEEQRVKIKDLESSLYEYTRYSNLDMAIVPELKVLFPQTKNIAMGYSTRVNIDSMRTDTLVLAHMEFTKRPNKIEQQKINEWLKARTGAKQLKLIIE